MYMSENIVDKTVIFSISHANVCRLLKSTEHYMRKKKGGNRLK